MNQKKDEDVFLESKGRGMPGEQPRVSTDWFTHSFGALYPIVYAHRNVESAAPEARFAAGQLALTDRDRLLDLCCGNGRHLVHLREHAGTAIGLDYSAQLLEMARQTVGSRTGLVRADMRAIPFENVFDVVTSFFTSFGYFFSEEENRSVVRGVARALRPGGRFFIDYLNSAHVERTLMPESRREDGGYVITETRWIDFEARRVNKTTRVEQNGETVCETGESVRLYDLDEFTALLESGGLAPDTVFGDHSGVPFDETQPRMIVTGHRK